MTPLLTRSSKARDSLFSQFGRGDTLQVGGSDLLASTRKDHDATVRLITQDGDKSQLIDRAHANMQSLDGADDDDELDLLLGDQAELHIDAELQEIEQHL